MTSVREPVGLTMTNSTRMAQSTAIKEEGTTFKIFRGSFGKNSMMSMLVMQMVNIQAISPPVFQWCVSASLKGWS